jgi:hypothetical protein
MDVKQVIPEEPHSSFISSHDKKQENFIRSRDKRTEDNELIRITS